MPRYVKIRTLDGQLLGETRLDRALPIATAFAGGVDVKLVNESVAAQPESIYWNGSGFVSKTKVADSAVQGIVGTPIALAIAADAYTQMDAESPINGPRTITLNSTGVRVLAYTGKYTGLITLDVRTLAEWEAYYLSLVDEKRETSQMVVMTPGGAKKTVYAAKALEAFEYGKVGAAAVGVLDLATRKDRFPYAFAEMAISGETLAQVIARFKSGITISDVEVRRVEAISQVGKRAIRAATTLAAKRTAFNAINWNAGK